MATVFNRRTPVTPRWILRLLWFVTRQPTFRPIWQSNLVSNDLLGQAEFLAKAGYLIASGMLARAYVERATKRLSMISPSRRQLGRYATNRSHAEFLLDRDVIDQKTFNIIHNLYGRTSQICHSGIATPSSIRQILVDCRSLRRRFEESTQTALSQAR